LSDSETEAISALKNNKDFLSNDGGLKYVLFKPSITNFSRKLILTNEVNEDQAKQPDSSVFSLLDSSEFKSLDYEVNFDVVSSSLAEAYQNCGKIQYLMRLFLKKNYSSTIARKAAKAGSGISNKVKVYIPSFIESGRGGEYISYDIQTICDSKAINLKFMNLDVDVDMESGFYEDGEKLFPKKMTVKCTFKSGTSSHILGYNYTFRSDTEPQWKLALPEGSAPDSWNADASFLFPYNRKTVKIGGS
jgi:hypothetical protein